MPRAVTIPAGIQRLPGRVIPLLIRGRGPRINQVTIRVLPGAAVHINRRPPARPIHSREAVLLPQGQAAAIDHPDHPLTGPIRRRDHPAQATGLPPPLPRDHPVQVTGPHHPRGRQDPLAAAQAVEAAHPAVAAVHPAVQGPEGAVAEREY